MFFTSARHKGFLQVQLQFVRGLFAVVDADHDGFLNEAQVAKLLKTLRSRFEPLDGEAAFVALQTELGFRGLTRDFFDGVWTSFDENENGFLEADEFEKLVASLRSKEAADEHRTAETDGKMVPHDQSCLMP
eukprot:SAG22_NODE_389_length_11276_cov_12.397244_2_plen_132_part_00